MEDYRARALVSVTEGAMYGPGDEIDGPFDPDDEHNAELIESGQITRLGAVSAPSKGSEEAKGAEGPAGEEGPAEAATAPEGGGEAPSPTIEPMSEPSRRGRKKG